MEPSNKTASFEKTGFGTLSLLLLAPFALSLLRYPFVSLVGGDGDAKLLVLGSLIMALIVGIVSLFWQKQSLWIRLSAVLALAIVLAFVLGIGFKSQLTLVFIFGSLGPFLFWVLSVLLAQLPEEMDGYAVRYKIKTVLFVALALFTINKTARLSVFMNDAKYVEESMAPDVPFLVQHSCLTAYVHAEKLLADKNVSLYDSAHWAHHSVAEYPPFSLDSYLYPTTFMLLPKAVFIMADSFQTKRGIWFGGIGLAIALGFWTAARITKSDDGISGILLIFLAWSSLAVMITLQIGNIQHLVMALAVMGMLAFERDRPVLGGLLLAFTIAAKVSPALLVIVLLAQRRWRDLAWTAGFGLLFTLMAVFLFGLKPMLDFFTVELPLLSSGRAMFWLEHPDQALVNTGPFGIPFKLKLLGMAIDNPWQMAKTIGKVYTLLIVIAIAFFSLKQKNLRQKTCFWLGILTLSGLQSPFAPVYVSITLLWALTLVAPEIKNAKGIVGFAAVWLLLTFPLFPIMPVEYLVLISFAQLLVTLTVIFALFSYKPKEVVLPLTV